MSIKHALKETAHGSSSYITELSKDYTPSLKKVHNSLQPEFVNLVSLKILMFPELKCFKIMLKIKAVAGLL